MIGLAVIIASWEKKDRLFYIRLILLLIPVIAQIRQILTASGALEDYPLFVFLVYFLLRLIGPLLNWHTHIQLGKRIPYFNALHIITYLLLSYVVYDFVYTLTLPLDERFEYVNQTFTKSNIFSFTYPIIQLLHVGQAVLLMNRSKRARNPSNVLYFMRILLLTIVYLLIVLQIGYLFFERVTVELVVAPIIFIIAYSVILFVSIRYSSIHNREVSLINSSQDKSIDGLSERENQVLKLIAKGKTDKEISNEINLSTNTVRTYISRIYSKLELKNRTEAANYYNKMS